MVLLCYCRLGFAQTSRRLDVHGGGRPSRRCNYARSSPVINGKRLLQRLLCKCFSSAQLTARNIRNVCKVPTYRYYIIGRAEASPTLVVLVENSVRAYKQSQRHRRSDPADQRHRCSDPADANARAGNSIITRLATSL